MTTTTLSSDVKAVDKPRALFAIAYAVSLGIYSCHLTGWALLQIPQIVLLIVAAPLLEEWLRPRLTGFTFVIILLEFYLFLERIVSEFDPDPYFDPAGVVTMQPQSSKLWVQRPLFIAVFLLTLTLLRMPATLVHLVCRKLSYTPAVIVHATYNFLCCFLIVIYVESVDTCSTEMVVRTQHILTRRLAASVVVDWDVWLQMLGLSLVLSTLYDCLKTRAMVFVLDHFLTPTNRMRQRRKQFREAFSDLSDAHAWPMRNHTHGKQAGERGFARDMMRTFAARMGLAPFEYQMSSTEMDIGVRGCRMPYFAKDLASAHSNATPRPEELITLVDVDYHLDMPTFLLTYPNATMLSTYAVRDVGVSVDGYVHTFTKEGEIDVTIRGGAAYKHKLWHYNVDHCAHFGWTTMSILGLIQLPCPVFDVRNVDVKYRPDSKALVLLTPMFRATGLAALFALLMVPEVRLNRFNPVSPDGEFMSVKVIGNDGNYISAARVGAYSSIRMPLNVYDGLAAAARLSKNKLSTAQVVGAFKDATGLDVDRNDLAGLCEFLRSKVTPIAAASEFQNDNVRAYSTCPYDEEPAVVTAFMQPLLHAAFAPRRSKENEEFGVRARITEIQSEVPATSELRVLMKEFAAAMRAQLGPCEPVDDDEVADRQTRPTQRTILESYWDSVTDALTDIQIFIKAESYGQPKPPRNIAILDPDVKARWSQYTYAVADAIKLCQPGWYAFSKTPVQIAERVADIASQASEVLATDCNRMDGTVSEALRELELEVMRYLFPVAYHDEIMELARKNHHRVAKGKFGTRTDTLWSRLSGSPETSIFNSMCMKFVDYVARRRLGAPIDEAFDRHGRYAIYGGDDGLSSFVAAPLYEQAARSCGLNVKCAVFLRGSTGVNFLARIYGPDVWSACPDSCCDIARSLSKLHTSTQYVASPREKLIEKARGLIRSDPNTPVIGKLARNILRNAGEIPGEVACNARYGSWFGAFDMSVQFPNVYSDWMLDVLTTQLPDIDMDAVKQVQSKSLQELLSTPNDVCPPPEPQPTDRTIYVDTYVVQAKPTQNQQKPIVAGPVDAPPKTKKAQRSRAWREKAKTPQESGSTTPQAQNRKTNPEKASGGLTPIDGISASLQKAITQAVRQASAKGGKRSDKAKVNSPRPNKAHTADEQSAGAAAKPKGRRAKGPAQRKPRQATPPRAAPPDPPKGD